MILRMVLTIELLQVEPPSSELLRGTGFFELEIPPGRSKTGNRRFRPRSFPCTVGFQYEPQNAAHGAEFTLFPRSYGNSARTERLVSSRSH
jgi:hypothetical protein